jgi:hypothetical protein
MGHLACFHRFAPTTGSLRIATPDRLRQRLSQYCLHSTMYAAKSQVFSVAKHGIVKMNGYRANGGVLTVYFDSKNRT